jgi:hypothetical protein
MGLTWRLCADAGPIDFHDSCIRSSWSALLPAALVFFICLSSIRFPLPNQLTRFFAVLKSPFQSYLNLHEAEALDFNGAAGDHDKVTNDIGADTEIEVPDTVPLWRTVVFAFVGLVEALSWLSYGSYNLVDQLSNSTVNNSEVWGPTISPFLIAGSWVYTVVRPVIKPTATPPYDLVAVYCLQLVAGVLLLGGVLFEYEISAGSAPLLVVLALSANIGAVVVLLFVVGSMPMGIPSTRVKKEDIVSFLDGDGVLVATVAFMRRPYEIRCYKLHFRYLN